MTNILDRAIPVTNLNTNINVLLYGESGVGKTVFGGSGRNNGKDDLLIALEQGSVSAAVMGSQVNTIPVNDWATLEAVVEAVGDEPDRYSWVVVDSVRRIMELAFDKVIGDAVARKASRNPHTVELQEYGMAYNMFQNIIRRLNGSEANILYLTTQLYITNNEGMQELAPNTGRPGRNNTLVAWILGEMDMVIHMRMAAIQGKLVRVFTTQPTVDVPRCKDRLNLYQRPQANLTLAKLTDDIEKISKRILKNGK